MTFVKGKSGNPAGRPKENPEIKAFALSKSMDAIKKIYKIMNESDDNKSVLSAAKEILDRALGKPAQAMELTGQLEGIIVNVNRKTK